MAIAPRLDLRQSQTLVMTPQLRQAIKLLQFSNIEVGAFVEEELERNPLLERDEHDETVAPERAAPDQVELANGHVVDAAEMANSTILVNEASAPLDTEHAETYDAGGPSDGAPTSFAQDRRGGSADFRSDERDIGDLAETRPTLRDHLGAQLRLSFAAAVDRMIGAHLIALLCPAGRLTARPCDIADAMAIPLERVEAVRAAMLRFDPVGLFA